jgi:hypothetical protein
MKTLIKVLAFLLLIIVMISYTYFNTDVTTVTIKPEDVCQNYAFQGRVVMNDNQSYYIGTSAAFDMWVNQSEFVYSYRWFK